MFRARFDFDDKNVMPPLEIPPDLVELVATIDRLPGVSTLDVWDNDGPHGSSLILKVEHSIRGGFAMHFVQGCVQDVKQAVKPPHGPSITHWFSAPGKHDVHYNMYRFVPGKRKSRGELVARLKEPFLRWDVLESSEYGPPSA